MSDKQRWSIFTLFLTFKGGCGWWGVEVGWGVVGGCGACLTYTTENAFQKFPDLVGS